MLLSIILFVVFFVIIRTLVFALIASASAVFKILALMLFISILLIFASKSKPIGWTFLFIVVLCFVGIDVITSHPVEIIRILAVVVTIFPLLFIKRAMWKKSRTLKKSWQKWIVRIL